MTADRTVIHLEGTDFQKSRAFSPAVVTQGGKIVWLAGQTALIDLDGKSIAHDFEAQARACFTLIDRALNRVGGKLADLVTMTVSINDPRYGDQFIKIRHDMFPNGKFPCSALIKRPPSSIWSSISKPPRRSVSPFHPACSPSPTTSSSNSSHPRLLRSHSTSAVGQKRTLRHSKAMSALTPISDIGRMLAIDAN